MNWTVGIVLGVIILVALLWYTVGAKKKRWYKIERANNSLLLLYRTNQDIFRSNQNILRFKNEQGHEVILHWHWILSLEEIPASEVEVVRGELKRIAEAEMKASES